MKKDRFIAVLVAVLLVTCMAAAPAVPVGATTISQLQDQYDTLQQQQKQVQQQLNQNKSDQSDTKARQTELNESISIVRQQVSVLTQKIAVLNSQITQRQQQITSTQQSVDKNTSQFEERLRAEYMSGDDSFIEVLLSSTSITDFLTKEEILISISTHDTELIANLRNQLKQITAAKKSLEGDKADMVASNTALTQKKSDLNSKVLESNSLLAQQQQQATALTAKKEAIQAEMNAANKQIEALKSQGKYVGGAMLWPLQGITTTLTSTFSWRTSPTTGRYEFHVGIDITKLGGGTYGHPILAANAGIICLADTSHPTQGYGNHIVIDHGGGMMTLYGHASSFASGIAAGVHVSKGQVIAYVGSTGNSTGPHLHFSVLINGIYVNPLNYPYSYENCNNSNYYRHVSPYYKSDPS
ncbi:MAG: peptidoglycan DD-metalloendopeptidase family protein [Clostridia bacterium]|nr:peptidoglycan DD-metalloendopeptidase family protein [Clostridia bacterium]